MVINHSTKMCIVSVNNMTQSVETKTNDENIDEDLVSQVNVAKLGIASWTTSTIACILDVSNSPFETTLWINIDCKWLVCINYIRCAPLKVVLRFLLEHSQSVIDKRPSFQLAMGSSSKIPMDLTITHCNSSSNTPTVLAAKHLF